MVAIRNVGKGRGKSPTEQDEAQLRAARDVRRLREFSTFDKFSDHELQRLVRTARHESRSTPWPLIHERTPSDACYVLLTGEAGVYVGRDLIATLGPGEVIGESAIRSGKLRSATVTTTGPAEALRIDRDDLAGLLDELPSLREAMDATVARHTSVTSAAVPTKPEPKRARLTTSVPAELVTRFEQAAGQAGLTVAAALEEALTNWIGDNGPRH